MIAEAQPETDGLYERAESSFADWELLKDVTDELIDLALNYRQSGHPGGSRSKVHLFLSLLLSGAMRWDLLRPWRRFGDRFVLSAGHTVPLVYCTLATLNEVMRARYDADHDPAFAFPDNGRFALTWEDLPGLRHRGGLPGHAEMAGKSLFLKYNTGPSGHGMPPAAGEALALKLAGADEVKVFVVEGEGGLTPGASHETRNAAWGLGLSNLVFLVDWNDNGIDHFPASSVVYGDPQGWFGGYGWRVFGTNEGMEWGPVTRAVLDAARSANPQALPSAAWFRTIKGRGYGKTGAASHGTPHGMNSAEFWAVRRGFMERYGIEYAGLDAPPPADPSALAAQARENLSRAVGVLRSRTDVVERVSDRLRDLADSVPDNIRSFRLGGHGASVFDDKRLYDFRNYPPQLYKAPGDKAPNRAALSSWGAWVNAFAKAEYGRPLFIAASADLAESTNIAGFAKDFGELPGWGWFERTANPTGTLLPTEITEFTNAGLVCGLASVNVAEDPLEAFDGFWGACSTYASFSYLKYGSMRLFSQLAQDADTRVGKVLWIAGHSGPETAEDSRTHFGIYETAVTQLFPNGHVIDLHPWEHNEVPVMLGAALRQSAPIVALHLTRPSVPIPDREALGMPSHFEAARGAYVLRPYRSGESPMGVVFVRGTIPTANLVSILPQLDERGLNVKVVAALSPQLFALQDAGYRASVIGPTERWDAMAVTNGAFRLMRDWLEGPLAAEYSLSPDWDDRWRTGGTVDEVMDEAHLGASHILDGIERFARDRDRRLARLRESLPAQ